MKDSDLNSLDLNVSLCPSRGYPFLVPFQIFKDHRGSIINISDGAFRDVAIIKSEPGALRAGHYHKSDWHLIFLLTGRFLYKYTDSISQVNVLETLVNPGELILTPPKTYHSLEFSHFSEMVVLSKNARDTKNYEKDTFRIN